MQENKKENFKEKTFLNTFPKYMFGGFIAIVLLSMVNIWINISSPTVKIYYGDYNYIVEDKGIDISDALWEVKYKTNNKNITLEDIRIEDISLFEHMSNFESFFWRFELAIILLVFFFVFILYPLHRLLYGTSVYDYW